MAKIDANNKRFDLTYTPLGYLANVWLPGRAKASQSPSLRYTYRIRTDGTVAISTAKPRADGTNYKTSYELYDGQLRLRQTQQPAPSGGRLITDTSYTTRGLIAQKNRSYYHDSTPDPDLADQGDLPSTG